MALSSNSNGDRVVILFCVTIRTKVTDLREMIHDGIAFM